jgi:hypothetical protein
MSGSKVKGIKPAATMPKRAIAQTQVWKLDSFPLKLPNCAASGKSRMTTAHAISQAHAVLGARCMWFSCHR